MILRNKHSHRALNWGCKGVQGGILIMIMKLSISIGKYEVPHQFVNHNSSDLDCEGCIQLGRMMPSTPHTQDKSQKDD